jgi:hypothetical protein
MNKFAKSVLVLGLVFAPLFLASPARAETIQFTYYWTTREFTFTDQLVTVTVTNDITNKIGYGGEVIDTYRISVGGQLIEVTEKHTARDYTFEIIGTQTITLSGIDNGYWAGNYGPVMTISSQDLTPVVEPISQSPSVSATISESVTVAPELTQSATLTQSPVVEPTPTPSPEPLPEPAPAPQPTFEVAQPEPSLEPTASPEPEPTSDTQSPEPEPVEIQPSQSAIPTQSEPSPIAEPLPEPTPESLPTLVLTPSESNELPFTDSPVTESEVPTISENVFIAVSATLESAVKAVGELVAVFQQAGLDLTPEQRKEAQEVVVSTIMTSQVAVAVRKIK